jgi:hypothetical protein
VILDSEAGDGRGHASRLPRIAGLAYWWLGFASLAVSVTAWPADETSLPAPETVLQAATARLADSTANKNNFFMVENLRDGTMQDRGAGL